MANKTVWLTAILSGDGQSWGPNQAVTVEGDEAARLIALGVAVEMEQPDLPVHDGDASAAPAASAKVARPRRGRKPKGDQ